MKKLTPQEILWQESEKYKRGCASDIPAIWHNIAINAIEFAEEQAQIIAVQNHVSGKTRLHLPSIKKKASLAVCEHPIGAVIGAKDGTWRFCTKCGNKL